MEDFMDLIDNSMKRVRKGDVLKGKVITVKDDEIIVNIGYIADGIVTKNELLNGLDKDNDKIVKVGDEISVLVVRSQDDEGNVVLSEKRATEIGSWDEIAEAQAKNENIVVKVNNVVKGGVTAEYKGVRCFIPGSLLSYRYVEDMTRYVGKELEVKIEDFDAEKRKVVLSRKAIEVAAREIAKNILWNELVVGETRKGTVTKLMKFGAFVDIGGAEGLIHLNNLAWNRVNHPSEVVNEGDEVEVYVISFDKKTNKISLGLKKIDEDPWNGLADHYKTGDLVTGKVVRILDFGAFVQIEDGVDGLVHISEISTERITKPADVLTVGQEVEVAILKIDEANKKLSLSMKEAEGQIVEETEAKTEAPKVVETAEKVEKTAKPKKATKEATKKTGKKLEIIEGASEESSEDVTTLGDLFGDKLKDLFK